MYQHMFWFIHPAVYIMVLPAMGMCLKCCRSFTQAHLWLQGHRLLGCGDCALNFLVWAHHMTTGLAPI
jgi:heme/copper-type cytochrome/quinol oxidase subunit 1